MKYNTIIIQITDDYAIEFDAYMREKKGQKQ